METSSSPERPAEAAIETGWKDIFLQITLMCYERKTSHSNILTQDQYASLLQEVKDAKTAEKKTTVQNRG